MTNELNFETIMTYESLEENIKLLEEKFDFLKVKVVGRSELSKNLYMLSLGSGENILYSAGIHALEHMTSQLLLRYVYDLCLNYSINKVFLNESLSEYFKKYTLNFLIMQNPDGITYVQKGIKEDNIYYNLIKKAVNLDFSDYSANARGVDLNHNYNAGFYEGSEILKNKYFRGREYGPSNKYYSGPYPESEKETQVSVKMLEILNPKTLMCLHSQGEEIYYSYRGLEPKNSREVANKLGNLSGYEAVYLDGSSSYSGYKDYFIKKYGRLGFTVEIGSGKNPLPISTYKYNYEKILPMLISLPNLV